MVFAERNLLSGRSGYFDDFGIVRDVMQVRRISTSSRGKLSLSQNHLLQVVALLLMDAPRSQSAKDLSESKTRLLRAIRPLRHEDLVLGQYAGYRQETGVPSASNAATFAACVLHVDSDRWRDVPVLLKAGKGLCASGTFARVHYRAEGEAHFTLRVQPNPGYSLRLHLDRSPEDLKFSYGGDLAAYQAHCSG